jgi:hypothetical protein
MAILLDRLVCGATVVTSPSRPVTRTCPRFNGTAFTRHRRCARAPSLRPRDRRHELAAPTISSLPDTTGRQRLQRGT